MKKCALILSGFLRNENNLKNLKTFLKNNLETYSIDIFMCPYDTLGLTRKASTRDSDTPKVTTETFATITNFNSCRTFLRIESYEEMQNFIKNFIKSKNLEEVVKSKKILESIQNAVEKPTLEWELNKILSQCYMNWLNIQELKKLNEKYDIVIKSRFDLNHHKLPKIPQNIEKEAFYGKYHYWINAGGETPKRLGPKEVKGAFPLIYDHYFLLHFNNLSSLEKAYHIESLYKRYRGGGLIKDYGLSCEINQSIGLFMEGHLEKIIPYECKVMLNRVSKY